jgi:hypothetical protein
MATDRDQQLSTIAAAALWAGSVLTAVFGPRRFEHVMLAAAATATIVDAIHRAHAQDVSEAAWVGLAAGKHIGGADA